MADQLLLASGYSLASTTTTVDSALTTKVPQSYIYTGDFWTTITNTLSVYGPGTGSATPVIQTNAGSIITTTGTAPFYTQTATHYVFPSYFLSRIGENYDSSSVSSMTSSSRSPTQTSLPRPISKGLSSGSVAGIGIGSAILGGLIALLFAWILCGRRPKHDRRLVQHAPITEAKSRDLESTPSNDAILLSPIQDVLPQPRPHSAITAEMSQLGTRIKNHAVNFYTRRTVDIRMMELEEDILEGMGLDHGNRSKLLEMLASTDEREDAIRYIIAQKVFACIQIPGNPDTSFLPSHVVALHRNISHASIGDGLSMLQSRWRVATARLIPDSYVQTSQNHVQDAHVALTTLLQPLVDREKSQAWSDNFMSVLTYAAQFGWGLFSQPAKYEFVWEKVGTGMVVYPGLVQVTNDEGELLSRANVLTQPLQD